MDKLAHEAQFIKCLNFKSQLQMFLNSHIPHLHLNVEVIGVKYAVMGISITLNETIRVTRSPPQTYWTSLHFHVWYSFIFLVLQIPDSPVRTWTPGKT